jgi:hypothetical protein
MAMAGIWLICESEAMQRFKEPIAAPIPGKHAAGAISAVCCRSQSYDDQ